MDSADEQVRVTVSGITFPVERLNTMTELPFSQACENNKRPILECLRSVFADARSVLEIGTGTAQHAVFFAEALPHLTWRPSDHPDSVYLGRDRLAASNAPNLLPFVALDVGDDDWPVPDVDAVFSANTAHIMSWSEVERMFQGVARRLPSGGVFCLYGPFNVGGRYTSDSNRRFDQHLRSRSAHMGIRDIADLETLARSVDLRLDDDVAMPANNRILVWRKR